MASSVGVRVRLLVTVLSTAWICWIAWGPSFYTGMGTADRALHTITGVDVALIATALVGLVALAGLVLPGPHDHALVALLGVSLIWWVFIAALFFVAGIPVAGGLAAIGSIGGFVAYWEARR